MKLASVITHPKTTLPQKEIVFGFIPSQEAENLDAKAKPLADALSKELGVPVKSFVGTNYNAVIEAMGAGKVDIGAYGPQSYVIAADKGYAVPAAASVRNGSKTYRAQFVVLKDSPLKKLEDVKGKRSPGSIRLLLPVIRTLLPFSARKGLIPKRMFRARLPVVMINPFSPFSAVMSM